MPSLKKKRNLVRRSVTNEKKRNKKKKNKNKNHIKLPVNVAM